MICTTLGSQDALEFDCSGVEKADVTAMQLLLSTAKTAQQQGCRPNLTAISPVLQATIERAGVSADAMGDEPPTHRVIRAFSSSMTGNPRLKDKFQFRDCDVRAQRVS